MNHEQIVGEINKRIDKLETKIDGYFEKEMANFVDIKWIKGYIRFSLVALLTVGAALVPVIVKLFVK